MATGEKAKHSDADAGRLVDLATGRADEMVSSLLLLSSLFCQRHEKFIKLE